MPAVAFTGAQQVLAFISICDRSFVIQGWHGALLTMAFVLAAIFFNTYAIGKLPILESLAVVFHIVGFFVFIIIIWAMGPGSGECAGTQHRTPQHFSKTFVRIDHCNRRQPDIHHFRRR